MSSIGHFFISIACKFEDSKLNAISTAIFDVTKQANKNCRSIKSILYKPINRPVSAMSLSEKCVKNIIEDSVDVTKIVILLNQK